MNILETERLHIRPFTMSDLAAAHQMLDHDIQWAGPNFSLDQRKERLQRDIYLAEWADTGRLYGYRAIILRGTTSLIGQCGFLPGVMGPRTQALFWPQLFGKTVNVENAYAIHHLEIGYALASQHRGRGYATEAIHALLRFAFDELRIQRIFASTNRSNTGSMGLMKRIGMRVASNPDRPDEEWPDAPGVLGVVENLRYVKDKSS